ncbi:HAD family hydrolase [Manganibacter manganicus]|uniref:Haloacid dehalogenase n=1 Tax=Manganibacter manganicus TaxID=1873176 RepID=A0A1V8RM21_9HYPH|nr:HAD family hydrolase [Pseudaminobacter manganicus]OQM74194.1 haloacid dehalogenase [Pseudaminobacter manganicus]
MLNRRFAILTFVFFSSFWLSPLACAQSDPLPSWNDGATKSAITEFIARVTTEGGSNYVAPAERIAVFDNDGTLWSEQPVYFQFAFAIDRVKAMAPEHPEWKDSEPFRSIFAGDVKGALASGKKGVAEIMAVTHAGMTTDAFAGTVRDWIATARHPKFARPYDELIYQPMVELLAYLRANGFKTFIVSGGGVEFMRPWVENAYGIPPEQVVGTSGMVTYELNGDKPVLKKEAKIEFIDDGPGKPVGINRFIGRRPIFAAGNSDGDLQMLQWTTLNDGPRFALIVHHTDAEREFSYDRESQVGKLDKALDEAPGRGWTVVDMKSDWKTVYPAAKQ